MSASAGKDILKSVGRDTQKGSEPDRLNVLPSLIVEWDCYGNYLDHVWCSWHKM